MKKTIALSFLFFATVILVAHAIVPHHHHEIPDAWFVANHSDCDESGSNHCMLEREYITTLNNKQDFQLLVLAPVLPVALSQYSISDLSESEALVLLPKPCLITYHTAFIARVLGLRAPPVC